MKKAKLFTNNRWQIISFALVFAAVGGVIALLVTRAAVPLVVDASVPQPSNLKVFADDRALTVTWNHSPNENVVGYYLQYKKKGASSWENVRQTTRDSIQLQPLENGQEYEITIQSARGTYTATARGDVVNHDSSDTLYWARADGHVSPISATTTVTGTPSKAARDAQAARLTGFFDDFNEPANPFNELKWNQASFCDRDPNTAMAFINPQFHSHNAIHCGFGGTTSRPRAIFDTSVGVNGGPLSESNPAQIEFDQDLIYDSGRSAWYLDLMPLDSTTDQHLQDLNARHDLHNADDEDPANMMRIQVTNYGMYYNWYGMDRLATRLPLKQNGAGAGCWGDDVGIDFRGCDMTRKTADFSGGLARQSNGLFQSAQNVRRHFVVQITPTRMKTYIDNVLIADATLPSQFAAKRKFIVQNTMFSYNTGKGFQTAINGEYGDMDSRYKGRNSTIPYFHFYHWDNFGFTGPAATTVVHNYVDGGPDGKTPNYLNNAGTTYTNPYERTTTINIPDDIGSPIGGKAKLYYSLRGAWWGYKWASGDHFVVNGRRHNVTNFLNNHPTAPPRYYTDGIGGAQSITVMQEIPISELKKGDNVFTFNFGSGDNAGMTSNLHLELEYTKGTEPSYTQPIDYFRSVGSGDMFSRIVEPPMTNCDSYIYIEQDIGLPKQNNAANMEPAPCYFLSSMPNHSGHTGAPTPLPNPDTTDPVINLTAPANNTTLSSNTITASATATDNIGINRVEFYIGGIRVGTDTSSPYESNLDFTSYVPGSYSVYAVAFDTSGRPAQTSSVNVIKPQPQDTTKPTITAFTPPNNTNVAADSTSLDLTVNSTDNVGVTRVDFFLDNAIVGSKSSPVSGTTYRHTINPASLQAGGHIWRVEVRDAAGNLTVSGNWTFTTVAPTTDPDPEPEPDPDPLPDPNPNPSKPGDINGDGQVNVFDLSVLLSHYGQTVPANTNGDLTGDGRVNVFDLSVLLSNYGK